MAETYARPRFGEPREPKNRVIPASVLVKVLDFVTVGHARAVAFLLVCGLLFFLPGFFNIPPIDRDETRFAQATKQMVETGITNDNEIVIKKGLEKDERVLLAPPADKTGIRTITIPGLKPIVAPTSGADTAKSVTLPAKKPAPMPSPAPGTKPKG